MSLDQQITNIPPSGYSPLKWIASVGNGLIFLFIVSLMAVGSVDHPQFEVLIAASIINVITITIFLASHKLSSGTRSLLCIISILGNLGFLALLAFIGILALALLGGPTAKVALLEVKSGLVFGGSILCLNCFLILTTEGF